MEKSDDDVVAAIGCLMAVNCLKIRAEKRKRNAGAKDWSAKRAWYSHVNLLSDFQDFPCRLAKLFKHQTFACRLKQNENNNSDVARIIEADTTQCLYKCEFEPCSLACTVFPYWIQKRIFGPRRLTQVSRPILHTWRKPSRTGPRSP